MDNIFSLDACSGPMCKFMFVTILTIHSVSNNNLDSLRNVSSTRYDLSFWSWYLVFAGACLTNQVKTKDGGLLL